MNFLRQLTVKQGAILLAILVAFILLGVIITSLNRNAQSSSVVMTNTPSINFDLFEPDPTNAP
jgi:hypothetical protein